MEKFAPLNLTRDEIIEFTPLWEGERFENGRPKVSDGLLERMKKVTLTQAWGVLRGAEYHWQFDGGWLCTQPGKVLVGRDTNSSTIPRPNSFSIRTPRFMSGRVSASRAVSGVWIHSFP